MVQNVPLKVLLRFFSISNMQSAIAKDTTEYKTQHTSISSILEDLFLVVCFTCIVCRTHMCMCIAVSLGNLYLYTLRYLCIIPSSHWSSIKWIGRNALRYSGIFEYIYDKNFLYWENYIVVYMRNLCQQSWRNFKILFRFTYAQ